MQSTEYYHENIINTKDLKVIKNSMKYMKQQNDIIFYSSDNTIILNYIRKQEPELGSWLYVSYLNKDLFRLIDFIEKEILLPDELFKVISGDPRNSKDFTIDFILQLRKYNLYPLLKKDIDLVNPMSALLSNDLSEFKKYLTGEFKYISESNLLKRLPKYPSSYVYLSLNRYDLLFSDSLLPRNDMSLFPVKRQKRYIHFEYIPVVRYSEVIEGSPFQKEKGSNFCGTFYYIEPESKVFLKVKKLRKYLNKYTAYLDFYGEDVFSRGFRSYILTEDVFIDNTLDSFNKWFLEGDSSVLKKIGSVYKIQGKGFNKADQFLCHYARENNIDALLFEKNPEHYYNESSEILDARDRDVSVNNLIMFK